MDIKEIALALALANRHPDPEAYAEAAQRALDTGIAYPDEVEVLDVTA